MHTSNWPKSELSNDISCNEKHRYTKFDTSFLIHFWFICMDLFVRKKIFWLLFVVQKQSFSLFSIKKQNKNQIYALFSFPFVLLWRFYFMVIHKLFQSIQKDLASFHSFLTFKIKEILSFKIKSQKNLPGFFSPAMHGQPNKCCDR